MGIRLALTAAAMIALCAPASVGAQEDGSALERIKAAFLYKFAAYVDWPGNAFAGPSSPIVIGVAGADAVAKELEQAVAGRKVGERPMEVRRLAANDRVADGCHILFVGTAGRSPALLAGVQGQPVLTVTDSREHPRGSVINFLEMENRVRFDISRTAAERNGLQLRSQLLGVARQVIAP